jgi:hypothetical protein
MSRPLGLMILILTCSPVGRADAEVVRVEVRDRQDVLDGRSLGEAGAYEKLQGEIHFAFDPTNRFNARIVDLEKAPRNRDGRVEARANFMVLRPRNASPSSGVGLVEVSNRGGKASLGYFNRATRSLDPIAEEEYGDALLLRQGLTVIWVGWQFDVPRREGLLRLHVPTVKNGRKTIEGLVRSDWVVDETVTTLALGHRDHVPYPLLETRHRDHVLTVRSGRLEPRHVVPRDQWRFAREENGDVVPDTEHIYMTSGFQAGKIYELVYRAKDPSVVGLGPAAIRDVISYAKYDEESLFPVDKGVAWGVSQTGRFLRYFLYKGFNTDEKGRKAYDGLLIHTAGAGRGSFNHRFGQPSRDAHHYSAFFYPTDIFPFTSWAQRDPETGRTDGLFAHTFDPSHLPKVFYSNSGYEYWGRAASLIHTTVDSSADVPPFPNERIYHLGSGQHYVGRFPPAPEDRLEGSGAYRGNPLDFLVTLRSLLVSLVEWVEDGVEPPPSAYPTIRAGTLVPIEGVRFPRIPGVGFPEVIHEAYRADYGPRWDEGIVDTQPPRLGKPFRPLVSQVDELGNEMGGARGLEVLAPLGTYAPWNLRTGRPGGEHELSNFIGTYIPLPRTEEERRRTEDPRPSIESLYPTRQDYLGAAALAAADLVEKRLLLPEDVLRVLKRAEANWDWIHQSGGK